MILLFDSSTPTGMLVLGKQGRVLSSATWTTEQSHSQKLQPQIDAALKHAGVAFSQLTHIAVGIGPGSFTGLRVALATAKGLGVALDIPIVAIPSLELFAAGCSAGTDYIMSTTDAFRGEVYVGIYDRVTLKPVSEIRSMTPTLAIETIRNLQKSVTLIGTGYTRYKTQFDTAGVKYSLFTFTEAIPSKVKNQYLTPLLKLVETYISKGHSSNPADIQPYYVRDAEAVEKKRL